MRMRTGDHGFRLFPILLAAGLAVALLAPAPPARAVMERTQRRITDAGIRKAVERQLRRDPGVPEESVHVRSEKGVVTLGGSVQSLSAKERAARIAETVRGVREVRNEIVVNPLTAPSAVVLRADVTSALAADPALETDEIHAWVRGSRVVLSGEVDSWRERRLAGRAAGSVRGVTEVENDISVAPKYLRSDAEIREDIVQGLRWNTLVNASDVSVRVRDGVVFLGGTVTSAAEKRAAILEASVVGAVRVDASALRVTPYRRRGVAERPRGMRGRLSDAGIRKAVERAVSGEVGARPWDVSVEVNRGVVTLTGEVDRLLAKRRADHAARRIEGVVKVRNRIEVKKAAHESDVQLERRVRAAIDRNPFVDKAKDVSVDVHGGTVFLQGLLETQFAKREADDAAAGVKGVQQVVNAIKVSPPAALVAQNPYLGDYPVSDYGWYHASQRKAAKSDKAIRKDIESELFWSPFADSDKVKVKVSNGVATLSGVVNSWTERRVDRENALEAGAVAVNNDLTVAGR